MEDMYVAVLPSPQAIADLQLTVDALRLHDNSGTRWSPSGDWHIALAFLGELTEDRRTLIDAVLQRASGDFGEFTLSLAGAGVFSLPDTSVLWAGVEGETARLIDLAEVLRLTTGADTTYPFSPHLTLAKGVDISEAVVAMGTVYKGPSWSADRLHLMRSHSGSGWGVGESVASWPLTGRR